MSDEREPPGRDAERLKRLGERIEQARDVEGARPERARKTGSTDASGMANALRLSSELVAGVVVGVGLGWFFDRFLGTRPFGLIVFMLLGFAAGALNLVRAVNRPKTPPTGSG